MTFKRFILALFIIPASMLSAEPSVQLRNKLIESIRYEGLETVPSENIPDSASLNIKIGQRFTDALIEQDINRLYLTGYFKSVEAVPVISSSNQIALTYKFSRYPTINSVRWVGAHSLQKKLLKIPTPIRPGYSLNTMALKRLISDIEALYQAEGYDLARVVQSTFTPSNDVIIDMSEGEINSVEILGISQMLVPVVLREIKSKSGTYFNTLRLRDDRERLLKLGYFADIESPRLSESFDHRRVNVTFIAHPRKTNSLDAGLEYYEQKGEQPLTGFIRTDLRHLIIPSDITSVKIQAAWKDNAPFIQGYGARYTQPWLLNELPLGFSIGASSEKLNEFLTQDRNKRSRGSYTNQRTGVDLELSYPFTDNLTVAIRAKSENVDPDESSGIADYDIRSLALKTDLRNIRNLTNPRNGYYFVTSFEVGGNLGFAQVGGLSFTRGVSTLATFTEITPSDVVATRITVGTFTPDTSNGSTFEAEGFDLGGPNTIRGYKETFPIFVGNKEVLMSVEYRHDVQSYFQIVGFFDAGQALTGDWPKSFSGFATGYGIGFRFYTPVGALRFDIAQGEALILHFGLGQTF